MLGRDDQAADIARQEGTILEGKADDQSSGSDENIHDLPKGQDLKA